MCPLLRDFGSEEYFDRIGRHDTKVVFNLNGSYTMEGMTADSGSFSDNVWTGSSSSVVFTAGDKQTRIDGITVTYAE